MRICSFPGATWRAYLVAASTAALVLLAVSPTTATAAGEVMCDGQVATIVGTEGDDELESDGNPDVIAGLGGNDDILGYGFDDLICGGPGNDEIFAETNTRILGGPGRDVIGSPRGANELLGGPGRDTLVGGFDADVLHAGPGDDEILPGEDNDDEIVRGGEGIDLVYYATDNAMTIDLKLARADGHGTDRLVSIENARSTRGNDVLIGDNGPNTLTSGTGNDVLRGARGEDTLDGEQGADEGDGGPGADRCTQIETATSCRLIAPLESPPSTPPVDHGEMVNAWLARSP